MAGDYSNMQVRVETVADVGPLKQYKSQLDALMAAHKEGATVTGRVNEAMEGLHKHFRAVHSAAFEWGRVIPGVNEGLHAMHLIAGPGGPLLVALLAVGSALYEGVKGLKEMRAAFDELNPSTSGFGSVLEAQKKAIQSSRLEWEAYLRTLDDIATKQDSITEKIAKEQALRSTRGKAEDELANDMKEVELARAKVLYKDDEVRLAEKLMEIEQRYAAEQIQRQNAKGRQKLADLKRTAGSAEIQAGDLAAQVEAQRKIAEQAHEAAAGKAEMPAQHQAAATEYADKASKAMADLAKFTELNSEQIRDVVEAVKHGADVGSLGLFTKTTLGQYGNVKQLVETAADYLRRSESETGKVKTATKASDEAASTEAAEKDKLSKLEARLSESLQAQKKAQSDYEEEVKKFTVESNERVLRNTVSTLRATWDRLAQATEEQKKKQEQGIATPKLNAEIQTLHERIIALESLANGSIRSAGAVSGAPGNITSRTPLSQIQPPSFDGPIRLNGEIGRAIESGVAALIDGQQNLLQRIKKLESQARHTLKSD